MNRLTQTKRAFTLVELLTVIAIIGILAALIFPAIKKSLEKAEIARAHTEVKGIETAWRTYFNEYGRWPCDAAGCLLNGNTEGNFDGQPFSDAFVSLMQGRTSDGPSPYVFQRDNPKGIPFLNISPKSIKGGSYVDPWGSEYRMKFDLDYDNVVKTNASGGVTNTVMVWSYGPDGQNGTKDDIRSWE
jgi:prepilin-type N-terminal cleavage/methylation domain-containing protein